MPDKNYIRKVQTSVTNFICCNDEYLFLKRNKDKRIDPGRLNGVGGRLEKGEDFLSACIRETNEETGFVIEPEDMSLAGVVKLEDGYSEDWVICFFKTKVKTKEIPKGSKTEDGELIWLHKDKVLDSGYELVDDINYCFKDIVKGDKVFFITAQLNDKEKIEKTSISRINRE